MFAKLKRAVYHFVLSLICAALFGGPLLIYVLFFLKP